ncbi:MAG: DMT family transporter [Candidatus Promineifilaceae bacterium]|nr:DMT family transporter [Candidatus Promineifilaceae bacterium]
MSLEERTVTERSGSRPSAHLKAVLQALLVTFLWSTSWVLIKIGLEEIPPLTFAGLRYALAFLILLAWARASGRLAALRKVEGRAWGQLILLGLLLYAVTQGAQFMGLHYLPAITLSLILSFAPAAVAVLGILTLGERLIGRQWAGIGLFLLGALLYFGGEALPAGQALGLAIGVVGLLTNAVSAVLGRAVNATRRLEPLTVTLVSMGVGSAALLGTGVATQGLPAVSLKGWLIIGWLAAVNTAFAFTLWNRTLRELPAVESSIINNTMLIQIAVLAWVFLGERPGGREMAGLALAAVGALLVQLQGRLTAKGRPGPAKRGR